MPTWLGFIWTSPNTLIGLVLGLLTFQRPTLRDGALIFDRAPRGLTWLMPRLHRTWGPLFIPVYFLLAIPYGYRRHPMEIRAQIAAGERPPARPDHPPG
jgi:hypothetical protein